MKTFPHLEGKKGTRRLGTRLDEVKGEEWEGEKEGN